MDTSPGDIQMSISVWKGICLLTIFCHFCITSTCLRYLEAAAARWVGRLRFTVAPECSWEPATLLLPTERLSGGFIEAVENYNSFQVTSWKLPTLVLQPEAFGGGLHDFHFPNSSNRYVTPDSILSGMSSVLLTELWITECSFSLVIGKCKFEL